MELVGVGDQVVGSIVYERSGQRLVFSHTIVEPEFRGRGIGTVLVTKALDDVRAPPFELPDLDGSLHRLDEWRGLKRLLVTFSSWCGCRYDLPGWQALHDELAPSGFTVIAVAIDQRAEDVRPWTEGITMPVLFWPRIWLPVMPV